MKTSTILATILLLFSFFVLACVISHSYQLWPLCEFTNWIAANSANFTLSNIVDAIKTNSWVITATSTIVGISGWIKTAIAKKREVTSIQTSAQEQMKNMQKSYSETVNDYKLTFEEKLATEKATAQAQISEVTSQKTVLQQENDSLTSEVQSLKDYNAELLQRIENTPVKIVEVFK